MSTHPTKRGDVSPSKGTPKHTVRITPALWDAASEVAAENGETVSDVIRRALIDYSAYTDDA